MTDSLETSEHDAMPYTPPAAPLNQAVGSGPNPHYMGTFDGESEELAALRRSMAAEIDRLRGIIDTPELVDFPKAVHLEAVHQEVRWGTEDREGKTPADWFRLVGHLSTRALEHHKEADRLEVELQVRESMPRTFQNVQDTIFVSTQIAHHREKAVHHCITTAAALNHWHASILGKHTSMRPGFPAPGKVPA